MNDKKVEETPSPDGEGSRGNKGKLAGVLGLGMAGMVLVGLVVINGGDDGEPASASLSGGTSFDDDLALVGKPVAEDQLDDDVLIGDENDDLVGGGDDILSGGGEADDSLSGGPDDDVVLGTEERDDNTLGGELDDDLQIDDEIFGVRSLCVGVQHQPVDGQQSASGIWVRGEVYGLEGGWIWVEGPTINNGEPVQIPVVDGTFDGPLGINAYGEHPLDRFDLVDDLGGSDPVATGLPQLDDAFGAAFQVGPDEGPMFDQECFEFEVLPEEPVGDDAAEDVDDDLTGQEILERFVDGFVADHQTADVDGLLSTLHPSIPNAFGQGTCEQYLTETAGSIVGARVLEVGDARPFELTSPSGPVTFDAAVPATIEFDVFDGTALTTDANFPIEDDRVFWLTTCGVEVP